MDSIDNQSTMGTPASTRPMPITQRELDMIVEMTKLRSEIVQIKEARDKQAIEYERRLDALNHENVRVQSAQDTFLPREVYQGHYESTTKWRDDASITLTQIKASMEADKTASLLAKEADKAASTAAREAQNRQFTQWMAVIGLVLTILTFVLNYVIK